MLFNYFSHIGRAFVKFTVALTMNSIFLLFSLFFSKRASAMLMKDASLRTCSVFGFPKRKESKTTLIELTIPSDTFFSCYIIHDVDDVVSTLSLKC